METTEAWEEWPLLLVSSLLSDPSIGAETLTVGKTSGELRNGLLFVGNVFSVGVFSLGMSWGEGLINMVELMENDVCSRAWITAGDGGFIS